MKHLRLLTIALLGACSAVSLAQNVVTNNLNPKNTSAITGFVTTGSGMDGMTVTVTYGDGSVDTAVWGTTGTNAGAASFAGLWSLSLTGDSFNQPWTFSTSDNLQKRVSSIFLDGGPGKTVFDIKSDDLYSPNSGLGWPFQILSGITDPSAVTATYSSPLGIGGNPPIGDLFVTLNIDLGSQALAGGQSFTFRADTDNALTAIEVGDPVPEPFTMALVGGALVAALKRRRSRK